MLLSRYRQVVLFCPTAVTGGPEALHQFAAALEAIGVSAYIFHFGAGHPIRIADGALVSQSPPHAGLDAAYAPYQPRHAARIELNPETLVVFPEGVAGRHRIVSGGCGVAIWWLSVDNFFRGLGDADPGPVLEGVRARPDLIHLYQSAYARDWLRAQGLENIFDLSDYTSPLFLASPASAPGTRKAVSYNAAKGKELADGFFGAHPEFDALALRGYAKPELQTIFRERLIYVDFGHFPGKDRMPREAAVSGSIVFVHRKGAAALYEDFPLPDRFKFTEADIASGVFAERLRKVMAEPEEAWRAQASFRSRVLWEKAEFGQQVMRHWGLLPKA